MGAAVRAPATKLKHMAEMAAVLDAGDMKDLRPAKRHALILALIRQMRIRARDDVAEMFIRRIGAIHKSAREELQVIQARQRELSEELVATLEQVLEILAERLDDGGHRPANPGSAGSARRPRQASRRLRGDSRVERRQPLAARLEAIQHLARRDVSDG